MINERSMDQLNQHIDHDYLTQSPALVLVVLKLRAQESRASPIIHNSLW